MRRKIKKEIEGKTIELDVELHPEHEVIALMLDEVIELLKRIAEKIGA